MKPTKSKVLSLCKTPRKDRKVDRQNADGGDEQHGGAIVGDVGNPGDLVGLTDVWAWRYLASTSSSKT